MRRYIQQHIKTIIGAYQGELPLAHFLKNYYKKHPKLGSRDRRILSAAAYAWYRCSRGIAGEWLDKLVVQWINEPASVLNFSLDKWLADEHIAIDIDALFPHDAELSSGISRDEWLRSMLVQPDLFIRVRINKDGLLRTLGEHGITYTNVADDCIALPNGAKIDAILPASDYVVQDASSQMTGKYFMPKANERWYDCCCGAGGKSLLLKDMEPAVQLTVSDKRESIIHNLQQRFRLYGIGQPKTIVTDLADKDQLSRALGGQRFDNIICDAPCSGSGTWARTPEQLYFFDPASIEKYSQLQKTIAANVLQYLKPGGRLIYITCSVFKAENEDVVSHVIRNTGAEVTHQQIINGVGTRADSMFVAIVRLN